MTEPNAVVDSNVIDAPGVEETQRRLKRVSDYIKKHDLIADLKMGGQIIIINPEIGGCLVTKARNAVGSTDKTGTFMLTPMFENKAGLDFDMNRFCGDVNTVCKGNEDEYKQWLKNQGVECDVFALMVPEL